jgi:hypothetical protein
MLNFIIGLIVGGLFGFVLCGLLIVGDDKDDK